MAFSYSVAGRGWMDVEIDTMWVCGSLEPVCGCVYVCADVVMFVPVTSCSGG